MSLGTAIEWTQATWNPVRGCSRVSQGCVNCYAERIASRFSRPGQAFHGFAAPAPRVQHGRVSVQHWTGRVELQPDMLDLPLRWKKPRTIFVDSMSDLFHEKLTDEEIAAVFGIMALAWHHQFQILTKRAERMWEWFGQAGDEKLSPVSGCVATAYVTRPEIARRWPFDLTRAVEVGTRGWPLPNVCLGVSVEDQATADERIPLLLQTPAAVRFISAEPLLGPIDLKPRSRPDLCIRCGEGPGAPHNHPDGYRTHGLDWVIVGGESGPGARPTKPAWVRSIRDQCQAAHVPFFFKQWGGKDKKKGGRMLDGRTWDEMPMGRRPAEDWV